MALPLRVECIREEPGQEIVASFREADLHQTWAPSIQLGRASGTRTGPARPAPVLRRKETGLDESVEVEGRQRPPDPKRRGGVIAPDEAVLADDMAIQRSACRLGERCEFVQSVVQGRVVHDLDRTTSHG